MKITTIGRGKVGGGLARLWRAAGHDVTELGKDGGDAADADAVLLAVPSGAIDDALAAVTGLAYDEVRKQAKPPGNLYVADDEARDVVEQLIRDAGFEPLNAGGLEHARALENFLAPLFAVSQNVGGPVFHRIERA